MTTVSVLQAYEDFGARLAWGGVAEKLRGAKRLLATGQGLTPEFQYADHIIVNSQYMSRSVRGAFPKAADPYVLMPPLTLEIVEEPEFDEGARQAVGFVNRAGKNLDFVLRLAAAAGPPCLKKSWAT